MSFRYPFRPRAFELARCTRARSLKSCASRTASHTFLVQVVADLLMIVCGTTASYIPYDELKWILFTAGCVFYVFILYVCNDIFTKAIDRFTKQGERGEAVAHRLYAISRIFFFSWTLYPIFFLLSSQGLCAVAEKWIAMLHMIADLFAKNIFGILMWHTLWQKCKGNWQVVFSAESDVNDVEKQGADAEMGQKPMNFSRGSTSVHDDMILDDMLPHDALYLQREFDSARIKGERSLSYGVSWNISIFFCCKAFLTMCSFWQNTRQKTGSRPLSPTPYPGIGRSRSLEAEAGSSLSLARGRSRFIADECEYPS